MLIGTTLAVLREVGEMLFSKLLKEKEEGGCYRSYL